MNRGLLGEHETLEGSGRAGRGGAEASDQMHVATNVEAFDGDDANRAELPFFLNCPFGDEAGSESGLDRGNDGDDGVEIHRNAQVAEPQTGAAQSQLDDAAGAGAAFAHQQRNLGESANRNGGFGGPGITAADDEHETILKETLAEDLARGDRAFDESEIDFVVREGRDNLFGIAAGDGGRDARMLFEEGAEHAGQDVLRDRHGSADAEGAGGFTAQRVEGGASFSSEARTPARVAEEDSACIGEMDAAFAAVEERGAQFFFEGANLLADGGLAQVKAFSGAAETGFLSHGAKDLQPKILHERSVPNGRALRRTSSLQGERGRLICRIEPSRSMTSSPAEPSPKPPAPAKKQGASRGHAVAVATGILCSRLVGLVRDRVFAHYFGASDAADAFRAAFRIPNILQNLFGEGVLSASFIPVYARLRAEERHEEASQLAEAVFALLVLITAALVALGVLATPWLIDLIAPGFHGPKRQLTIELVQILFPGAALLVLSAWCLGILNSHRKFLLSYSAPVVWNLAMITTLLWAGRHHGQTRLAVLLAIGSVVGSGLQFLVQVPAVLRFLWPLRPRLDFGGLHVATVTKNFFPVFLSRGVVQISAYVDSWLGSFLGTGAVAALAYAQTLYTLPVSLFGMAVSAAELPAMSSELGSQEEIAKALRGRLKAGLAQIAFFVIPSAVGFVILGDVIVATIYRTGHFGHSDVLFVWAVLAGASVGLLASTSGRLYSSAFYALRDTRTPLNFAVVRVALTLGLGYLCALPLPRLLGIDQRWGTAGLTVSAGIAGWVEFLLLRRAMHRKIGAVESEASRIAKLWLVAILCAAAGFWIKRVLPIPAAWPHRALLVGPCVLIPYAALYLGITQWLGIGNARVMGRLLGRRG